MKGAESTGAEVILFQTAETLPQEMLTKTHGAPKADVPVISVQDLLNYDALIFVALWLAECTVQGAVERHRPAGVDPRTERQGRLLLHRHRYARRQSGDHLRLPTRATLSTTAR